MNSRRKGRPASQPAGTVEEQDLELDIVAPERVGRHAPSRSCDGIAKRQSRTCGFGECLGGMVHRVTLVGSETDEVIGA